MEFLIQLGYLISVGLFIFGLKQLQRPSTARRGNMLASAGMLLAIVATLFDQNILSFPLIIAGLVVGSAIGALLATRIQMTEMPQLVAVFNGLGGLASAVVGLAEFFAPNGWRTSAQIATEAIAVTGSALPTELGTITIEQSLPSIFYITAFVTALSLLIGGLTFSGSLVAFGKLQGLKITPSSPVTYPGRMPITILTILATLGLIALFTQGFATWTIILILLLSLVLGVMLVMPIGGADMPVVVSLLNSYSGLAACATGFIIQNELLIVAGALVGASGLILTAIMCEAMNRSLANVLLGGFGAGSSSAGGPIEKREVPRYDALDAAAIFSQAQQVVIVPGYGMAVAQAQHAVRELEKRLEQQGAEVRYAIHPVAGRMPGHMNVLLAEADVPYDKLVEMDEINPELGQVDVALIIGANDVVNPAAREEGSPIYGMPIIEVDKCGTVMIIKRSLSPGYAGIDNELFYDQKTMMLFGDAKQMADDLAKALDEV